MPGRNRVSGRLQRDAYEHRLADRHRDRAVVALAAAQVEQPARDQRRGPVGRDVAHANRYERPRLLDAQLERRLALAQQLDPLLEGRAVPAQRGAVIGTLVEREVRRARRRRPTRLRRCPSPAGRAGCAWRSSGASVSSSECAPTACVHASTRRRGPGGIGDPAARPLGVGAGGRDRLLHVADQPRLVEEPVLLAIEARGEEPQALLQEADRRPRVAVLGAVVPPRADQSRAPGCGRARATRKTMSR